MKDQINNFATLKYSPVTASQINNVSPTTLIPSVVTVNIAQTFLTGLYDNIPQLMPPGLTSIPNVRDTACFMNLSAGQSNPYIIGYNRSQLLSIISIDQPGESVLHSNFYSLNLKNNDLVVYYSQQNPQSCHLPIGEGYVMMSKDFIAQFEALVNGFNELVEYVNEHKHFNGTAPDGNTGLPISTTDTISINSDIETDKNWLDSGHALINEDGINLPH